MADTAKLTGIEAGRGLAATAVVLFHVSRHLDAASGLPQLRAIFQFGHAGVDVFFVISGFIILYVHYSDIGVPARLAHYAGRRFSRVMPTYWVALAITLMMAAAGSHAMPSLADLAWSSSLLPSNRELFLGIAWTLRHEVVFYILFAVLILNRSIGLLVLAHWLAAIIVAMAVDIDVAAVPRSLYGAYNLEFFFGMVAACAMRNRLVAAPRILLILGLTLFTLAAVTEDLRLFDGQADVARLIYGIPAMLIVAGVAEIGRGRLIVPPPLRMLGTASYSIYLFQFVFIGAAWQFWLASGLDRRVPGILAFPLLAGAAVAGGIMMSRWIEYPLIQLLRGCGLRVAPRTAIG